MNAKDLVNELCYQLGLPNSDFAGTGGCSVVFDKTIDINIEADENLLHIFSNAGAMPKENAGELCALLLEAHLFGYGTRNAYFGLDSSSNNLVLFRTFELEKTDYILFYNALESFVNTVETWRKRISSFKVKTASDPHEVDYFIKV